MAALWRPNHAQQKSQCGKSDRMRPCDAKRQLERPRMIGGVVWILMSTSPSTSYRVEAFNLSHASENKIHDDTVAQKLGFAGGLVPGVEVYAYACHPAVQRWGRLWLERGQMQCRFLKPVYDGRIALVSELSLQPAWTSRCTARACFAPPATLRWGTARRDRHRSRSSSRARPRRHRSARRPAEASLAEGTLAQHRPDAHDCRIRRRISA